MQPEERLAGLRGYYRGVRAVHRDFPRVYRHPVVRIRAADAAWLLACTDQLLREHRHHESAALCAGCSILCRPADDTRPAPEPSGADDDE